MANQKFTSTDEHRNTNISEVIFLDFTNCQRPLECIIDITLKKLTSFVSMLSLVSSQLHLKCAVKVYRHTLEYNPTPLQPGEELNH